MNAHQKFYLTCWSLLLAGFISFMTYVAATTMYADYKAAEVVKLGVINPIEAKILFNPSDYSKDIALLLANKGEKINETK